MAAGVVVAFLFRHDVGPTVGIGALLAVLIARPDEPARARVRQGVTFSIMVLAMLAPYLVYVEIHGGLWNYVARALQQNAGEVGSIWPNPFVITDGWGSQLLYLFHAIPIAAMVLCAAAARRGEADWSVRCVACIAAVGFVGNFALVRSPVHIPDAIVAVVVTGSWLVHRAWQAPWSVAVPSIVLFVLAGIAVGQLGDVRQNLNRADLTVHVVSRPALLSARFKERSAVLHDRFGDAYSRYVMPLRPFFLYLERCTTEEHRLFLHGMIPEVAYVARRPFAAGGYDSASHSFRSPADQQQLVERLRDQLVPFAIVPGGMGSLDADFPILGSYLHTRYALLADVPVADKEPVHLLVDRTLPPTSTDPETGWPCFVSDRS
jgi:hypothetical protein